MAHSLRNTDLDETSTSTVQKPRNVVTLKEQKQVSKVTGSERGTLVTTCCFVNALGYLLPPVMIFPRVHLKQPMIKDAPSGTLVLAKKRKKTLGLCCLHPRNVDRLVVKGLY